MGSVKSDFVRPDVPSGQEDAQVYRLVSALLFIACALLKMKGTVSRY